MGYLGLPGECCLNDKCGSCTKNVVNGLSGEVIASIVVGGVILSLIIAIIRWRRRVAMFGRAVRIRAVLLIAEPEGTEVDTSRNAQQSGRANPGYPAASYPSALPHPAPIQNPPPYYQYPQNPGRDQLPQQAQDPPPAYGYSAQ